jgi:hypothetical protein
VNIASPTVGELDAAQGLGARVVRVFASPDTFDAGSRAQFQALARTAAARGIGVSLVLVNRNRTDHDPAAFAARTGAFAAAMRGLNQTLAYEIWNEEDAVEWWGAAPDPSAYVALFHAASAAVRLADPAANVVLGPTTGNNYAWIEQLYGAGLQGSSFDAAAVHTDTACLTSGPDAFYRVDGRLGQFTFLGYREVHASMAARGDGAKPIWMTELGWASTGGAGGPVCASGESAGKKPAGVTQVEQAEFLKAAYHCLALDPYVEYGLWFTLRDDPAQPRADLRHYGLVGKPSGAAFQAVAAAPNADLSPGAGCGDFDAPAITIKAPGAGHKFVTTLLIQASASDAGVGLGRITFRADGAKDEILNFTSELANDKTVELDWQGAKHLALGRHTITVEALDLNGNASSQSVEVDKVKSLAATLASRTRAYGVRCKRRRCVVTGRVSGPAGQSIGGKAKVYWQRHTSVRRKGKRPRFVWKTLHKGTRNANRPFTFAQRIRKPGRWRVQVRYLGQAPLKPSRSKYLAFRVR